MKRRIIYGLLAVAFLFIAGCSFTTPINGGMEGVFVRKPLFFGSGGVVAESASAGRTWRVWTTSVYKYDIKPQIYEEIFVDLITADNNPVQFSAFLRARAIPGKTPILHELWGQDWYRSNVQQRFRMLNRDFAKSQILFDLTSDQGVADKMRITVLEQLQAFATENNIPVEILDVNIGRILPDKQILEETVRTAAQAQRVITEHKRSMAEVARKDAEMNKALADREYRERFGMSNPEYLELRRLEIEKEKIEVVKDKENVSIILGNAIPMWPLKPRQ